jgi:hypothetical protein
MIIDPNTLSHNGSRFCVTGIARLATLKKSVGKAHQKNLSFYTSIVKLNTQSEYFYLSKLKIQGNIPNKE